MGNELSPHSARLFKFLHSWIVKVWRVRQYLEESGCQGHIKVLEANSCDGQTKFAVCPQGHRTTISAYYVIWDDGRLRLIGHWTTTDEERGMLKWSWVSRKRWGSGTYMSYICHIYTWWFEINQQIIDLLVYKNCFMAERTTNLQTN